MTLNDYQQQALKTAKSDDNELQALMHWVLGLSGEAGEVADKLKKWIRDNHGDFGELDREAIVQEVGDVLWYVAVLADELGFSLDQVAKLNGEKLASRQKRGVLGGSGDNR